MVEYHPASELPLRRTFGLQGDVPRSHLSWPRGLETVLSRDPHSPVSGRLYSAKVGTWLLDSEKSEFESQLCHQLVTLSKPIPCSAR